MKKKFLIFIVVLLVLIAIVGINLFSRIYTRYDLGDYGVSIQTMNSYIKEESEIDLLNLFNPKKGITINVRDLKGDFWSSDDMSVIMDEYIRLISAMYYDSNVYDVKYETTKLDYKEVGKVEITINRISSAYKTVTILTHKQMVI